jgi:alanine racemase
MKEGLPAHEGRSTPPGEGVVFQQRMQHVNNHPTRAIIRLDHLSHNMQLLQDIAGNRPMWPAIKANAYGHGADIVARHLIQLGYDTLCVAHFSEAKALLDAGIRATFIILSASLPAEAGSMVAIPQIQPVICTMPMAEALSQAAVAADCVVSVHVKVDTGMGRVGIRPEETVSFLQAVATLPGLRLQGLMSHFACADAADKTYSLEQVASFQQVLTAMEEQQVARPPFLHMANSAGIFDVPSAHFDAVRPGISIYGLVPSNEIVNPRVKALKPVLELKSRITFLKSVPANVGLSYGHTYRTERPSLIATVPLGYGDGLSRLLSNRLEVLVGKGTRCPQRGRVTMDQILVDVTALEGQVQVGDEVVVIGSQGTVNITADEHAQSLGTINYEIVTALSQRVVRQAATC